MKKFLLFISASFLVFGAYSQNCETTPPSSVKVKTADGNHVGTGDAIWVCEDLDFEITGSTTTAYIEAGCVITITGNDQATIYMKAPGSLIINGNGMGTYVLDSGITVSGSGMSSATITTCDASTSPSFVKYNYKNVPSTPGCIDTSTVGIRDFNNVAQVKLYPNPANSVLNVEVNKESLNSDYRIYNVSGKVVLTGRIISEFNTIDITSLVKGLYFIEIENANGKVSKRISVE